MQSELERNKEAVTRFNKEVIGQGNIDAFQALMDSEFVNRSAPPGMDSGPNGMLNTFNNVLRPALPDMQGDIRPGGGGRQSHDPQAHHRHPYGRTHGHPGDGPERGN